MVFDCGNLGLIQGEDSSDLNLKILRSMFLKNSADQGGAVWIDKGVNSVRIEGTTIKENTASTQAGGMGIRNVPQCLLTGVTATDNRAGIYGGALSFEVSQVFVVRIILMSSIKWTFHRTYLSRFKYKNLVKIAD